MKKIAIVTANFGNRDRFSEPIVVHESADYYAFVDKKKPNSIWKQNNCIDFSVIDDTFKNRRNAKIYKILPELFIPNYEYYIWVDVTHDVLVDPNEIIDTHLKNNDIALFKQRERNCVYTELNEVVRLNVEHKYNYDEYIKLLNRESYPKDNGLYECPSFIKRCNNNTRRMSMMWWELICKYCSRDQVSLPYVLWKLNITPSILPGLANGWDVPHLKSKMIQQTRIKGC